MADAFIVDALRTGGGRRDGALKDWHAVDLGAAVLNALVERTGIDPSAIDDVIVGCVSQIGEQSCHVGRNMVLASKLPDSVPAVSIDRKSLMLGLKSDGIDDIAAICGGCASCGTCHVHVAEDWLDRLPPMQSDEDTTLSFSDWRQPNSRLSCQFEVSEALDGLVVTVAPED